MGRSRYRIHDAQAPHFHTCIVVSWLPIFTRPDTAQILLDAFAFLQRERSLRLYGYVILENHLHWIADADDLPKSVASFKSYTAKQLVHYFEAHRVTRILDQLAFHKRVHKDDREHQVWEEGSHPQLIQGEAMLRQKLDYCHRNPVERGFVDEPEHWRWSSARNYAGREGLIEVFTEWMS